MLKRAATGTKGGRPYRLLHVFPSFAIGGQQRRLAALAKGLGPDFAHTVLSLDADFSASRLFDEVPVIFEPLSLKKRRVSWSNLRSLRGAIDRADADLLCTYNFGSIEAAFANRAGRRLPHVHHEDGFGGDESEHHQKQSRVLARRVVLSNSLVAVPSVALERAAREVWRLDAALIRRIPIGIDAARFRRDRTPRNPVIVGALGALRPEKNFARLIRCFAGASEGRDARLVIYGEGPEHDKLRALAAENPASDKIAVPGVAKCAEEALAEFDIFALSSDTEQMPTSLLEAMASGLPAVATDVGDVRLIVSESGAPFVTAAENEAGFSARLQGLIDDPALRLRLGEEAAARAGLFSDQEMIAAFRTLYREAMGAAA